MEKAEKTAAEAFEAAVAVGVIMYDIPNCPQKTCHVETSSSREGSTTHSVTASFETAFEVDIEVAAAVKTALVKLANCPSVKKDEFRDLLRKISQNPDTNENDDEQSYSSPNGESNSGSKLGTVTRKDGLISQDLDRKTPVSKLRQRKCKKRPSPEKLSMTKLVNMMFDRLQRLQENELSSLATIVATCGLNAALTKIQNNKQPDSVSAANSGIGLQRRLSSWGNTRRNQGEQELPSLDKFLVKHVTKLEKEVQEARNNRQKASSDVIVEHSASTSVEKDDSNNSETLSETMKDLGMTNSSKSSGEVIVEHSSASASVEKDDSSNSETSSETMKDLGMTHSSKSLNEQSLAEDYKMGHKSLHGDTTSSEVIPDLGSMLIKRSSKLEKEVEEARRNCSRKKESLNKAAISRVKEDITELPSLDKLLVKRVSRLEKEVQEAKNRRKMDAHEGSSTTNSSDSVTVQLERSSSPVSDEGLTEKENVDLNKEAKVSLEQNEVNLSLQIGKVIPTHQSTKAPTTETVDGLDKIMVKPVHRLERERIALANNNKYDKPQKKHGGKIVTECESLDKVLIKHVSRLEMEKMKLVSKEDASMKVMKVKANVNPTMEETGGLDQIMVRHKSRLEREKLKAAQKPEEDHIKSFVSRREAREKMLNEAWEGLSLGNSMRPHLSKLERDKVKSHLPRLKIIDCYVFFFFCYSFLFSCNFYVPYI